MLTKEAEASRGYFELTYKTFSLWLLLPGRCESGRYISSFIAPDYPGAPGNL